MQTNINRSEERDRAFLPVYLDALRITDEPKAEAVRRAIANFTGLPMALIQHTADEVYGATEGRE